MRFKIKHWKPFQHLPGGNELIVAVLFSGRYAHGIFKTTLCTHTAPWEDMEESLKMSYMTGQIAENCTESA